jgi:hypothetical protein
MRGVKIKYFFILKIPKKKILSSRRFFLFRVVIGLGEGFAFFKAMDWLNKVPRVFPRCFEQEIG